LTVSAMSLPDAWGPIAAKLLPSSDIVDLWEELDDPPNDTSSGMPRSADPPLYDIHLCDDIKAKQQTKDCLCDDTRERTDTMSTKYEESNYEEEFYDTGEQQTFEDEDCWREDWDRHHSYDDVYEHLAEREEIRAIRKSKVIGGADIYSDINANRMLGHGHQRNMKNFNKQQRAMEKFGPERLTATCCSW